MFIYCFLCEGEYGFSEQVSESSIGHISVDIEQHHRLSYKWLAFSGFLLILCVVLFSKSCHWTIDSTHELL